jgi:pyruvate/2-oxoglutarate dehydrogenase complex dihydrolipoamide acyltransferase (E2) component
MGDIILPKLGMGATEATISQWKANVGDKVNVGDPLAEIEMEKVTTVLESTISGTVKEILFEEGEIVQIGSVICVIEED